MSALLDRAEIDRVRSSVPLLALVRQAVKLVQHGEEWTGLCPFHDEKTPSFYVNPGKGLYKCWGCGAAGDALTWITRTQGLTFGQVIAEYRGGPGDFEKRWGARVEMHKTDRAMSIAATLRQEDRVRRARQIGREALPIAGTPAEAYLRRRGIKGRLPAALRYMPRLAPPLPPSMGVPPHPALVAEIAQDELVAWSSCQRIYLDPAGAWSPETKGKAGFRPNKATLAPMGTGAVRLEQPGATLGLSEAVEKALAAMQMLSLPVWATCGGERLGRVKIPDSVDRIVICGDADGPGRQAAGKACDFYESQGYEVELVYPTPPFVGFDDETMAGMV